MMMMMMMVEMSRVLSGMGWDGMGKRRLLCGVKKGITTPNHQRRGKGGGGTTNEQCRSLVRCCVARQTRRQRMRNGGCVGICFRGEAFSRECDAIAARGGTEKRRRKKECDDDDDDDEMMIFFFCERD